MWINSKTFASDIPTWIRHWYFWAYKSLSNYHHSHEIMTCFLSHFNKRYFVISVFNFFLIRAPLCRQPFMICLSAHPSVRPSVCLSVRDYLSVAYLISPRTNLANTSPTECRVPFSKGYAITELSFRVKCYGHSRSLLDHKLSPFGIIMLR